MQLAAGKRLAAIENREVRVALDAFRRMAQSSLGDALLGIYISGSLVMGDYEPASSDIDFLVVTRDPLMAEDLSWIRSLHAALQEEHPAAARFEGAYAAVSRLSAAGIAGPLVSVASGLPAAFGPADYTADNMWALRHEAIAVCGPPSDAVLPVVGAEDVRKALRDYLGELVVRAEGGERRDPAQTLLNMARCLFGIEQGRACTKTEAAEWLGGREPALTGALRAALRVRHEGTWGGGGAVQDGLLKAVRLVKPLLR